MIRVLNESVQVEDTREEVILLTEVKCAIKELKKGKALGADNKVEQIQFGGETTVEMLHKLCNTILKARVAQSMDRKCDNNNPKEGKQ